VKSYKPLAGVLSLISWKRAKLRETWDKRVSETRQQEATDWFIAHVKKDENEK